MRNQITTAKPEYCGKAYIEGRIRPGNAIYAALEQKAGPGMFACLAHDKQIMIHRQGDDSYRIYLGVTRPEPFARSLDLSAANMDNLRAMFLTSEYFGEGDWAEELRDIVRHATEFWPWPLYNLAPEALCWKSVPGVTLIGDAAHVSTPFAGEGVNCAMVDALVLAEKIVAASADSKDGALDDAVTGYEADMFVRGKAMIMQSTKNKEVFFHENAPASFLEALGNGDF
jgi:2-polyprenyl-6-methoxyphenol hydroxylase-like FAD-dependent oxidoreductase